MDASALLLLADLCAADTHEKILLKDPTIIIPTQTTQTMEVIRTLFQVFRPYEFVYKTARNTDYRVRVQLMDIILQHDKYKPALVLPACTKVG